MNQYADSVKISFKYRSNVIAFDSKSRRLEIFSPEVGWAFVFTVAFNRYLLAKYSAYTHI